MEPRPLVTDPELSPLDLAREYDPAGGRLVRVFSPGAWPSSGGHAAYVRKMKLGGPAPVGY